MPQTQSTSVLNLDALTAEQFINLIGIDSFNRIVALKHYRSNVLHSFEEWYDVFDKDGITLPRNEKGDIITKDRTHFVAIEEEIKEEKEVKVEVLESDKKKEEENNHE